MPHPRSVDEAIARFDDMVGRIDGKSVEAQRAARRRRSRQVRSVARRFANIGIALAVLIVATIGFAFVVGPIGISGLFAVAAAMIFILIFFSVWPTEKAATPYSDKMPTPQVVRSLDHYLHRQRGALPPPALHKVDAISAQLPLLESRLAEMDPLDPLAQDARRLMGKHLPDLIDRYERVPAQYRNERDGEGMTVDERLLAGLDAARSALGDIGAKLTQDDLDAFETQGRFIESRYQDGGVRDR